MAQQEEPPPFDWEAPDAFERWAESHLFVMKAAHRMSRKELEQFNAIANFQADRATAWFLKAVDGIRTMRELAHEAASLLAASKRGGLAAQLKAADATTEPTIAAAFKFTAQTALNQSDGEARANRIRTAATFLLSKNGGKKRGIMKKLEGDLGISKPTITKALATHVSGLWSPKRSK